MDIYLAASQLGKYPPVATSTLVNSRKLITRKVGTLRQHVSHVHWHIKK